MKKRLLLLAWLTCGAMFLSGYTLQAQVAKTVDVTTAGSLSTLLTDDEKNTVTSLTITGSLNSTDFSTLKTMATSNSLADIDLSGAAVDGNTIPQSAFYGCSKLKSIILPNSVTSIGNSVFYGCTGLTSFTIPSSITTIGNYAFMDCKAFTSIEIPNSVTSIGNYAFCQCDVLNSVTIPTSVTSIGNYAFSGCIGLTSIEIPNSIKTIEYYTFYNCKALTSVTIPTSVTNIGYYAFELCTALTSITIPNSVKTIEFFAFRGCSALTSIEIPNSVTSIGDYAFQDCTALTTISIPSSVTYIGLIAFLNTPGSVTVDAANPNYSSEDGVLFNKDKTILIHCPSSKTNYVIPSSVTAIYQSAFFKCTSLTSVTIPNSVTTIGQQAFENCTALTSVTIPNSVTSIGGSAFRGCTALTSMTIPNSVTSIGQETFSGCTALTSMTIPNSVTTIGTALFINCTALTSVTIPNSVTSIGYKTFYGTSTNLTINEYCSDAAGISFDTRNSFNSAPGTQTLHVPAGSKDSYTDAGWGSYFTITDDLPAVTFSLSSADVSLPCTGGSNSTVTVTSNMPWTAKKALDNEWLTISTGSNTLTIKVAVNTSTTARTATITVEAYDGSTKSITVTQAGALPPTVTTQGATSISQKSATGNGNITSLGSFNPTAYGICYSSTNTTPTIADSKIENGAVTATGSFTASLSGLTPGTLYYARAYATNTAGTAYGDVVMFNTLQTAPVISYATTSQVFTVGTAATTLTPSNTGGAVPATTPNEVSTFAGSSAGYADGTGTAAQFSAPQGLTSDAVGNIYVADYRNHKIRKISPDGVVTTFAGSSQGYAEGIGNEAQFNWPIGVATDATGNIIVTDQTNSRIRKITPDGTVSTIVQGYKLDGITYDYLTGNIFATDTRYHKIIKIATDGTVSTLAGSSSGYVNGSGDVAKFNGPIGVAIDAAGNIIVADSENNKIRKVTPAGMVSTIASNFNRPYAAVVDQAGYIFVTDKGNNKIVKIAPDGTMAIIAGSSEGTADGIGTSAQFSNPEGITIDATGNMFVADLSTNRIRKITPYGYTISPALPAGLTFDAKTGTISGTPTAASAATTYTITGSNSAGSSSFTIMIEVYSKQKLTVNAPTLTTSKVYDGSNTATVTDGAITTEIGDDDISVSATAQYDNASAGSGKTITVSYTISGADEAKYTAPDNYVVNTGEITARKLTLNTPALTTSKTYDGTTTAVVTSGSVTNAFTGDDVNATATATYDNANAGTAKTITVKYSLSGSTAANYAAPDDYVVNIGEIIPKAVTVTANAATKVYGTTDPAFTFTHSPALIGTDALTGTLSRAAGENAGNYAITQGTLSAGSNYTFSFVSKDFTITPKAITATADAGQTKVYGDTDPTLTYTVSPALIGTDVLTGKLSRAAGENVSNYAISQGSLSAGSNYTLTFVSNDFSITLKAITVTANTGQSKEYGDNDPTLTYTVSPALIGTDAFTGSLTRAASENIGNYTISQGTLSAGSNYMLSFVGKDFSINPKAITVTADVQTKVYGETDPALTYTCSPALIGSDVFTGTLSRATGENIGNYAISQGTLSVGSNYTLSFVPNDFAINSRQLMVGAPSITTSKTYDGTASSTVPAVTLTNKVTGDDVNILASATYNDANVGTGKTITATYSLSGAQAHNYTVPDNYIVTNGEITAVQLFIGNTTVVTMKVYDGSNSAAVTSVGQLSGVISSDLGNINVSAQAYYNDALPGANKTISVVFSLTGSAAGNYLAPANIVINGAQILERITLSPLTSPQTGCENSDIVLSYNILSGNPLQYRIVFDSKAIAEGFTDIDFTDLPSSGQNGSIAIPVPMGIAEGSYTASLQMMDVLNNTGELYPFSFSINLSADYIIFKFDDVVLCNDVFNRFTAYQWYKDGVAISGATKQFYNDPLGLSGSYSLQVVTTSGETLMSCPKSFQAKKSANVTVSAFPNPVSSNQTCSVKIDGLNDDDLQGAVLSVYNLQGHRVYYTSKVKLLNDLSIQGNSGAYVGHITTSNGSSYTFRIVVTK